MDGFVVFFEMDVGFSDILDKITGVVFELLDDLQRFVVLEYSVREMTNEVVFAGVSMKFVYYPYLFVYFLYILRSLTVGDLDLQVALEYEFAALVEFVALQIQSVHQCPDDDD
jgi:hypothetical protein